MIYKKLRKTKQEIEQDRLISKWKKAQKGVKQREPKPEGYLPPPKRKRLDFWTKALKRVKGKSYDVFMRSNYWLEVRRLVLERDGNKCTVCGTKQNLHVHHSTYKNHLKEHLHLEDLHVLCKQHHKQVHMTMEIK